MIKKCSKCGHILNNYDPTKTQAERLLDLLADREWHGYSEIMSLDIGNHTGRISDLRKKGHEVERAKIAGRNNYAYRLRPLRTLATVTKNKKGEE